MFSVKKYIPINFTYIAIVAMFFLNFVKIDFIKYENIQYLCIITIAIYIATNIKNIKAEYMGIETFLLLVYCSWSIYVSYRNVGDVVTMNPLRWSILYSVMLFECYLMIVILAKQSLISYFCNVFFKCGLGMIALNDMLFIVGLTSANQCLVGNKFDVAYLHILVVLLYYLNFRLYNSEFERKKWIGWGVLLLESVVVVKKVGCATGLVGIVLLVGLTILHLRRNYIFSSRIITPIVTIACMLFPFWYSLILTNHYITYFVEQILHKKISLTGRTYIYDAAIFLLGDGWKLGYGINTNYEICMRIGFVNIQNGMLKVLMESGIVGLITIMLLTFMAIRRTKINRKELYVIAAYLFDFIVLSSIEVNISRTFIFWALFMYVYSRFLAKSEMTESPNTVVM